MKEFTSPLAAWEGSFSLPEPNDFSGTHWKAWRESAEMSIRESYSDIHFYGYAGLELIQKFGKWDIRVVTGKGDDDKSITEPLPIAAVLAWESEPDNEKTKLIAFVGREYKRYISGIIDPKG